MPINSALLVSAPVFQYYIVDKDTGAPLSDGIVTLYENSSRTTLKNWYEQAFNGTSYDYIPLPNPMTLSAVGTVQNGSGHDVLPFFYPFSEIDNTTSQSYYITVDNSNLERQFVRENFPFEPQQPSSVSIPTLNNLLINNIFWRNIGTLNATSSLQATLAPGANNGYSYPDIIFRKNITGATDTITFSTFNAGVFVNPNNINDITPEYYINFNCSGSQVGETFKVVQIPIDLHLLNLKSATATLTLYAQNVSGASNGFLDIFLWQFNGSAAVSPAPVQQGIRLTLNNNWIKYTVSISFPDLIGVTLPSTTGDDAFYLQIGLPIELTCNINFTKPCLYIGSEVPTNEFVSYDQIDSVIGAPRTGDLRVSLNAFVPYGWVAAANTTIGNSSSGATGLANTSAYPLYALLWNGVSDTYAPVSGGRGVSAVADWTANKTISLTKQLGNAVGCVGVSANAGSVTNWTLGQTGGFETHNLTVAELPTAPTAATITTTAASVAAGTDFPAIGGAAPENVNIVLNTSGQTALNYTQPTTAYNMFYKL